MSGQARVPVENRRKRMQRLHFVGIGGSGMSGIAEVYLNLGYHVSGCDARENKATRRLRELGAEIFIGHDEGHVKESDVLVVSSAIKKDNTELLAAHRQRLPVVPRAEMLGELMRYRYGIAVAGTHGKTTTTSLIAHLLAVAGLDPTFVIGGILNSAGTNARLGAGEFLVAEADESDASFLYLNAMISIVTNIDADHLSTYEGEFERLKETFIEFLHHLPFYGAAILCVDDEEIRRILPAITRTIVTYGVEHKADFMALNIRQSGHVTEFDVQVPGGADLIPARLHMPGLHNVQNALAAVAVAFELGIDAEKIQQGLDSFQGIGRRFQEHGEILAPGGRALLVDDYAHHPREIRATMDGARQGWPDRRLVVVFQPHRYSRTRDLFDDFVQVLSAADVLVLSEVYPAGEQPIHGADSHAMARAIRARGKIDPILVNQIEDLGSTLEGVVREQDLVLTMGAGNIGTVSAELPEYFASRR